METPEPHTLFIDDGDVQFHRIDYDISRTVQDMVDAGIDRDIVEKTENVLRSGGNPAINRAVGL